MPNGIGADTGTGRRRTKMPVTGPRSESGPQGAHYPDNEVRLCYWLNRFKPLQKTR